MHAIREPRYQTYQYDKAYTLMMPQCGSRTHKSVPSFSQRPETEAIEGFLSQNPKIPELPLDAILTALKA
jgi:hypothetical protein